MVVAAWNEPIAAGAVTKRTALMELAERLRSSAPELVVSATRRVLADRGEPDESTVRANALLATALVRLGRYAEAVEPALGALRETESARDTDLAAELRSDLAACARALGEPLLGCAILRPLLETDAVRPARRAVAVDELVGCTVQVGRRDDLEDALAGAGRMLAADDTLTSDARLVVQARLGAGMAAYHRRHGETEDAADAAREGLTVLSGLSDTELDIAGTRARLTLELVYSLLDDGVLAEAEQIAEPALAQPVRASAAPAAGRLLLAMATRVYLPAGRVERGRSMLGQAARLAERFAHDWLLADTLSAAAHDDESAGRPADSLSTLHAAHAAERRARHCAGRAKRLLMIEFGLREYVADEVSSLLRSVATAPAVPEAPVPPPAGEPVPVPAGEPGPEHPAAGDNSGNDAANRRLPWHGPARRVDDAQDGDRPVALTLVRLDQPITPAGDESDGVASPGQDAVCPPDPVPALGRVRDIAPQDTERADSGAGELAVLLPPATHGEPPAPATTLGEPAVVPDWPTQHSSDASAGSARTDPGPDGDADTVLRADSKTMRPALRDGAAGRTTGLEDILARLLRPPAANDTIPEPEEPDSPGPWPGEIPQPPHAPDILIPDEPDPIPSIPPEPQPPPETPDPPSAELDFDPPANGAGRPDRTTRRRDRTDAHNLAILLAEAMAAYQSTGDTDEPPLAEGGAPEMAPRSATEPGASGRHRLTDWATSDADVP